MKIPNILIVEDDKEINNLISDALIKENYNITQVFDGRQAIERYNNSVQLIILDLMLTYVDGIEVLRTIREKSNVLRLRWYKKHDRKNYRRDDVLKQQKDTR